MATPSLLLRSRPVWSPWPGMGTVWVVQEQRVDDAQQQAQQLQDAQARVAAIVAAGDAQFRSVSVPGGGTMTVAISRRLGDGVVLMENLPRPPDGKVYQLWLIAGNRPTSIAVMADGQVSGTATVDSLGNADSDRRDARTDRWLGHPDLPDRHRRDAGLTSLACSG